MTSRFRAWRDALFGLFAGIWLSLARAPLGVDWIEIPATDGRTARWFRAAGVGVVALALLRGRARSPVRTTLVLWTAALGFALHAAYAAHVVELVGWWSLAGAALVACVALAWLARDDAEDAELVPAIPLELLGCAAVGAGVGLALDRAANTLRMTSLGRPADDGAMAFAFLVLVAFGASAFGPLLSRARTARLALPIAATAAAAACWEAASALNQLNDREGFDNFLRHPLAKLEALFGTELWGLSANRVGQLDGDLLLAARVLVLPALLLGTALACARDRRRLAAVLGGAALQFVVVRRSSLLGAGELPLATARAAVLGTTVAAAGAVFAFTLLVERAPRVRAISAAACAAIALALWFAPLPATLPLSPWSAIGPAPSWTASTDAGLATVERVRDARHVATLDRRRLTPLDSELRADAQRLRFVGPARSVLFVGQLTPARVAALKSIGVERIDRTAVWWRAMSGFELALFDDRPVECAGEILEPSLARNRVSGGNYDVIVVPPIEGASPAVEPPTLPARTRFVAWLDARAEIVARYWGERVLLSSDGGEQLAIGVANGELGPYPAGDQAFDQLPIDALLELGVERPFLVEARTARRLAEGARGTPSEKLAAGLARHFAVQAASSPFESRAQGVEIDREALELLSDAALEREPDAFVRELWDTLAATLVDKRDVESIDEFVAPLAERWRPWPALEIAIACADLEQLDVESALAHLDTAVEAAPKERELRRLRARALASAGRADDAVREFEAALALDPARRELRRELAMALSRAGDPRARPEIEKLLSEVPDDAELRRYLEPGPPPPAPRPLAPARSRH